VSESLEKLSALLAEIESHLLFARLGGWHERTSARSLAALHSDWRIAPAELIKDR